MDITKYMKHLPTCNIMQDWSEAETAMADTPDKFRDHNWAEAREELNTKMGTCTCGLIEAKEVAKNFATGLCEHKSEDVVGIDDIYGKCKCGKIIMGYK